VIVALPQRGKPRSEMPDVVITPDEGDPITVDLSKVKLPDGYKVLSDTELSTSYLTKEAHNTLVGTAVKERFKNHVKVDEATSDQRIIDAVLAEHAKTVPDIEQAKEQWTTSELAPIKEKYGSLKQSLVRSDLRASAKEFFDDSYTTRPPNGGPSWAEAATEGMFKYNDDHGYVVATQEGVPIPSDTPTAARPYRGVAEHYAALVKQDGWKQFAKAPPKGGSGSGHRNNVDGDNSGNTKRRSDFKTDAERTAFMKEHGTQAYFDLQE